MADWFVGFFGQETLPSLQLVIFAFFIGACVAAFATVFHRRTTASLVRYLLQNSAFSPETARSLRDAELEQSPFVRFSLRHSQPLKRIIRMGERAASDGKKCSLSDVPLYIAEDEKERAEKMYRNQGTDGANLWALLVSVVVFGVIAYLSTLIIPYLSQMVRGMFGA